MTRYNTITGRVFEVAVLFASCFAIAAGATLLAGCAPDIKSLAQDPATLSVHQIISAPGWTITTDVTRSNSTNTAATANGSGTAVNVAPGAVVNTAPASPTPGTTVNPQLSPNGTTINAQPPQ